MSRFLLLCLVNLSGLCKNKSNPDTDGNQTNRKSLNLIQMKNQYRLLDRLPLASILICTKNNQYERQTNDKTK